MHAKSVDLGRAFSVGLEAFKRYPGVTIGAVALYLVLNAAGEYIPILNFFYAIFIQPPIVGGLVIFALNVINDRNPTVGDLFAGFQEYGKWMGTYWLLTAITLACCIPGLILLGIGAGLGLAGEDAFIPVVILAVLMSIAIVIAVTLRWAFVYYAAAEGRGTLDAFKRSAELTEGVRPQLLLAMIVLGLFAMCGFIALVVGVVVTGAIALCAFAAIYHDLKTAMEPAEAAAVPAGPAPTPVASGAAPAPTVIYAAQPTPATPAPTPPAPAPVQWYFALGGQRVGPLSQADLMARVQAGEVTAETLVWRAGMANWTPAAQMPELAPLLSSPPGSGPPTSA